jgi:hypothetical protein
MTHDPLCPKVKPLYQGACGGECHCELIAKVRAEMRTENGTGVTDENLHTVDKSIHDPLCARTPTGIHYIGTCSCELIAKVREDTIAKCIAALPHSTYCLDTWYDEKTSECFCESAACDRALRALQEKP